MWIHERLSVGSIKGYLSVLGLGGYLSVLGGYLSVLGGYLDGLKNPVGGLDGWVGTTHWVGQVGLVWFGLKGSKSTAVSDSVQSPR